MGQQGIHNCQNASFSHETYHSAKIFYSLSFAVWEVVARLHCVSQPSLLNVNRKHAHLRLPSELSGMTRAPVQAHA